MTSRACCTCSSMSSCNLASSATSAVSERCGLTPPASVAAWQAPVKEGGARPVAKAVLVVLAILLLSQYLAAFLFMWAVGLPMQRARPLTIAQFAYYYGERRAIRRKLAM